MTRHDKKKNVCERRQERQWLKKRKRIDFKKNKGG